MTAPARGRACPAASGQPVTQPVTRVTGMAGPARICRACGVTDVELIELGEPSTWTWLLPDLCSRCAETEGELGSSWERLARVCAADPDGVERAPLLGDDGLRTGRLCPYLLRADVYALLSWVGRLDGEPGVRASLVPGGVELSVLGRLGGAAVELVAQTHRRVAGAPGPVEVDALLAVARAELDDLGPTWRRGRRPL